MKSCQTETTIFWTHIIILLVWKSVKRYTALHSYCGLSGNYCDFRWKGKPLLVKGRKKFCRITTLAPNKEIFVFENTLFSSKSSFQSALNCGLRSGKFEQHYGTKIKWNKKGGWWRRAVARRKKDEQQRETNDERGRKTEGKCKKKNLRKVKTKRKLICFALERVTLFCFPNKSNHNLSYCRYPHPPIPQWFLPFPPFLCCFPPFFCAYPLPPPPT